jgi:hypothetical protein
LRPQITMQGWLRACSDLTATGIIAPPQCKVPRPQQRFRLLIGPKDLQLTIVSLVMDLVPGLSFLETSTLRSKEE